MLTMLFGAAKITMALLDSFVVPVSGLLSMAGTLVLTVIYVVIVFGLIYQDNGIETPMPSF